MPSKPSKNKFAAALKPRPEEVGAVDGLAAEATATAERSPQPVRPSRKNTKHVGGYFDPAVSKQLRVIAAEEDTSVQALIAEGLDLVFQARRKPMIAKKETA